MNNYYFAELIGDGNCEIWGNGYWVKHNKV